MFERTRADGFNRRELMIAAAAGVTAALPLPAEAASADDKAGGESFEAAFRRVVGEAQPTEGKIKLELPEIAENGNTVPFNVTVEAPMTDESHVKAVHILSAGNPQPAVATFHFTPQSGKAAVAGRMRLAKTQDVVGIAELSDGKFYMHRRNVKVTIGGCGG